MRFFQPLEVHKRSIKTNPLPTLISDAIILAIVIGAIVAIDILVIINYGFSALLILVWVLLGSIALWLACSIYQCAKNLKKKREKEQKKPKE